MSVSKMLQERFNDRMKKMLRTNDFVDMSTSEKMKFNFDLGGIMETSDKISKQKQIDRL